MQYALSPSIKQTYSLLKSEIFLHHMFVLPSKFLDYMSKISINWPVVVAVTTVNWKSGMAGRTHL